MQASRFVLVVLLAIFSAIPGCHDDRSRSPAAAVERYSGRGKIVALAADKVDIHHERIPAIRGFDGTIKPMDSMTMPFARNQASFSDLAVGDIVAFEFTVHYDAAPTLRLTRITKLPPESALELQ